MAGSQGRDSDWLWWLISMALGGVAYWSDHWLPEAVPGLSVLMFLLLMLVAPGVLGYLKPRRPWRWALGFLFLVAGSRLLPFLPIAPTYLQHPGWLIPTLAFFLHPNVIFETLRMALAIVANFAGVYLGAFIKRRTSPPVEE